MARKNIPIISNIDMSEIYRRILLKIGDKLPSFLIFENQPFDMMWFEMPSGRRILYCNNCNNVCKRIISEIKNPKAEKAYAENFMVHSLEDEDVSFLYCVAVIISEMLDIPCPQVEFRDHIGEKYGYSVSERNWIVLQAVPGEHLLVMIRYMAHEMRHLWQYKYHPEYNESYKKPENGADAYLNCIAENDAEAWSSKLCLEVLGIDDITENKDYQMGNVELKERILKLRNEIELDEEGVYRLKMYI